MEGIEALKNVGNAAFTRGDIDGAICTYTEALHNMSAIMGNDAVTAAPEDAAKQLQAILYSNLANAYLHKGDYTHAWQSASAAVSVVPENVKAHVRYVEAKQRGGYPFEAFVYLLRVVRPLIRELRAKRLLSTADASHVTNPIEHALCEELGLTQLSPDIELVDYGGGFTMISRGHFAPGSVVFVEQKYQTFLKEADLSVEWSLTTEKIVLHFAKHLRPEQAANTETWQEFRRQFQGAWPRAIDNVDADTRETVGTFLRNQFPDVDPPDFDELLTTALMCRFNCFHAGFFRVCALANHSCRANIAMKLDSDAGAVRMIAANEIQPGELMHVKYLSDILFLLGCCKRRALLQAWLFWCGCDRCAEDNLPETATQEMVTCAACGQYTHYPIRAEMRPQSQDPLLTRDPVCQHCWKRLEWSPEKHDCLNKLLIAPPQGCTAPALGAWLQLKLQETELLDVHPGHWIYRMLFYFYCLGLNGLLQNCVQSLRMPGRDTAHTAVRELLSPLALHHTYISRLVKAQTADQVATGGAVIAKKREGLLADTALTSSSGGSDALRSLRILWQLIVPFYPAHEMWAVHRMICETVLLHLIFQESVRSGGTLDKEAALELLRQHGRYLGGDEASRWMHLFNILKPQVVDGKALPTTSALKKAFGLR